MDETKTEVTSVNRRWLIKLGIFWLVCVVITGWGLLDGLVLYPARGEKVAQHALKDYLAYAEQNRRLRPDAVNVPDPASTLEALRETAETGVINEFDRARLQWLESLSRVNSMQSLTEANTQEMEDGTLNESTKTMFVRPRDTLAELNTELGNQSPPKALSYWDIPSQFIISAVFGLAALGITYRIGTTLPIKYRYRPESKALILPSGKEIAPADIEQVDKRRWHKFFVTLHLKSGEEYKFDLMRFTPLEQWILDMEKDTDNYEPEPELNVDDDDEAEEERADAQQPV